MDRSFMKIFPAEQTGAAISEEQRRAGVSLLPKDPYHCHLLLPFLTFFFMENLQKLIFGRSPSFVFCKKMVQLKEMGSPWKAYRLSVL